MHYQDITDKVLSKFGKKYNIMKQQYFIDENGNKYDVDGKNVKFKHTEREKEVANLLGNLYGGNVNLIPVVLEPKGIKTPDYIIDGNRFDLKEIEGTGKNTIYDVLSGKSKQSDNFIIDISKTKMEEGEAIRQIERLYGSKHRKWVNGMILIKRDKILKIYIRKK